MSLNTEYVATDDTITLYAEHHRDIHVPAGLLPQNVKHVIVHIVPAQSSIDRAREEVEWRRRFVDQITGVQVAKPTLWERIRRWWAR